MRQDDAVGGRRQQVLYVEDQPVNVLLMRALFERRPALELVVAESGHEALRVAAGLQPALLLLDLRLPDVHGSQLLPMLRRLPGCAHAPAVACTAEHNFDIAGTGFDELWRKPLNLQQVLARLDALLASLPEPRERQTHALQPSPPSQLLSPLHAAFNGA